MAGTWGLFGKGGSIWNTGVSDKASQDALDKANKMATQTPQQKEANDLLFNGDPNSQWAGLTGWMKNPPKITSQNYQPTPINFGGGNPDTFSLANLGGGGGYQQQSYSQPQQQSNQSGSQALVTPKKYTNTAEGAGNNILFQPDSSKPMTKQEAQAASNVGQWSAARPLTPPSAPTSIWPASKTGGIQVPRSAAYPEGWAPMPASSQNQGAPGNPMEMPPWMKKDANGNWYSEYGQQNQSQQNSQAMPQQTQQSQGFNMPDLPTLIKTLNSQGGYKASNQYGNELGQVMAPNGAFQYGGYNPMDTSGFQGYYSPDQFNADVANVQATRNPNENEQMYQDRLRKGLDTNIDLGLTDKTLQQMKDAGLDPLKEAYDQALKASSADWNRRGMFGSGFESGEKFGTQPTSITRNFMTQSANLNRDLDIAKANAATESAKWNASRQDQMLSGLGNLSQAQASRATQLAKDAAAMRGDYANMSDASKKAWVAMDESTRQAWNDRVEQQKQQDKQNILSGISAGSNLAQTDEANRQNWAKFLQGQQEYDQGQSKDRWQTAFDVGSGMAQRQDAANQANISQNINLQKDNQALQQQGIQNLLAFINGQSGIVNNQQQNYWNAFNANNAGNAAANTQNTQNAANLFKLWSGGGSSVPDWANAEARY